MSPTELPGFGSKSLLASNAVLGLVINPNSRRNKRHLDELVRLADQCPGLHQRITEQHEDVPGALEDLAGKSVNVLAISGGDGTVSRILTHLFTHRPFETMPVIAILRGGTANMTAGDVGLRGSVPAALRRLCDWTQNGSGRVQLLRRPVLRVAPGGDQSTRYGMFFGTGAIVQGIEYTNANIHSRGMKNELSLGLGLARSMWGIARQDPRFIRPTSISVGIDGNPMAPARDMILLLVSSLERLFLNMHPYWGEDNGKSLHMTTVHSPAPRLLRNLPSLLRGKPNRTLSSDSQYLSYNIDRIHLDFDGPFTLDGEIVHAHRDSGPVEISNGGELAFLRIENHKQ